MFSWGASITERAPNACFSRSQTLSVFAPKFDDDAINKRLFDPLLNGFGDSAVPIRELTLKSLVCITDRLDEKQLNDRLLRCLNKLQSDLDPGIRTNATIFVGKIACESYKTSCLKILAHMWSPSSRF
jgi:SCY1-like protein 1